MSKWRVLASSLLLIMLLVGCGGGGGGTPTASYTISGVAAAGTPINGTVYLKDSSNPAKELPKSINSDGTFIFNVKGLTAPFLLKAVGTANGQDYTLYSFAETPGVANINPLSNLAVVQANGGIDPSSLYAEPTSVRMQAIKIALAGAIDQIQSLLQPMLSQYGATATNFVSDAYVANHKGLDLLFDLINITVSNGNLTITNRGSGAIILATTVNGTTLKGQLDTSNLPIPSTPTTGTSVQSVLQTGMYSLNFVYSQQGISIPAISLISAANGATTQSYSYFNKASNAWSSTPPTGYSPSSPYFLTSSGWVQGGDDISNYTFTFNADGTATATNKTDGFQIKLSIASVDISGKSITSALSDSLSATSIWPLVATPVVFPSGSVRYDLSQMSLNERYEIWSANSDSGLSAGASLSDIPSYYADGSFNSVPITYIGFSTPQSCSFQFVANSNTINIYAYSSVGKTKIGTGTWTIKSVAGQQILDISIPSNVYSQYNMAAIPFFTLFNGSIVRGDHCVADSTFRLSSQSLNKIGIDNVIGNLSL